MIFNTVIAGGGSVTWEHVWHTDYYISTTSTTSVMQSFTVPSIAPDKFIYVRIRDNAGPRAGYAYGADSLLAIRSYDGSQWGCFQCVWRYDDSGNLASNFPTSPTGPSTYGVYVRDLIGERLRIQYRYSSTNSGAIDGTFSIDMFTIDFPDGYPSPLES